MDICLSVCLQRCREKNSIDVHQTHNKYINKVIIDLLRLYRTMVRVVSENAGLTLAEGERGRRPSLGGLSMRFVFNLISIKIL